MTCIKSSEDSQPGHGRPNPSTPGSLGTLDSRYPLHQTAAAVAPKTEIYFINFTSPSGAGQAFAYHHLIWVASQSPRQIIFTFSSHTVTITGFGLQSLYQQVLARTLAVVTEVEEKHVPTSGEGPVVTKIDVKRTEPKRTETDFEVLLEDELEGD